ncbi:hypothetical protein HOK68_02785 [Candidatus Woesearchaeota archaeon]|jgi:hypothetical protein|nr:hypothetical protein [Candidatus Woesearchaeota archaeon]MBT4387123.1 hypothetical protein [Candidatus Woesearchaeota archaeon]MBT4596120.1 hypothetical protein [Candidatus Woesearchaeota archaeon]MBT5741657.1 hypothetical protein [Candidatus Woesearchaeota archaeon]MBT6505678.1 hypothetical protein [Candidatus Woesearchaeota archaeon]
MAKVKRKVRPKSSKKQLSRQEEFDIMKLVLDKFLWFGFAIMAYGLFLTLQDPYQGFNLGMKFIVSGAIILLLFMVLIVKEYEFIVNK